MKDPCQSIHTVDPSEISAYRDGDLEEPRRSVVERHLEDCSECSDRLAEYDLVGQCLRERAELPVPSTMDARINSLVLAGHNPLWRGLAIPSAMQPAWGVLAVAVLLAAALIAGIPFGDGGPGPMVAAAYLYDDQGKPAVEVQFTGPVDRDSVVRSVQIEPPVELSVSWRGDILVVKPAEPVQPSRQYTLRIQPQGPESQATPVSLQFVGEPPTTPLTLATPPMQVALATPTHTPAATSPSAAAASPTPTRPSGINWPLPFPGFGKPTTTPTAIASTPTLTLTATATTGTAMATTTAAAGTPAATPSPMATGATATMAPAQPVTGTPTASPAPTGIGGTPASTQIAGTPTATPTAGSAMPTQTPAPTIYTTPSSTPLASATEPAPTLSATPTMPEARATATMDAAPAVTATATSVAVPRGSLTPTPEASAGPIVTSTATPAAESTFGAREPADAPTGTPGLSTWPDSTATPTAEATPRVPALDIIASESLLAALRLGLPRTAERPVSLSSQQFENGMMLWRSDTREIFILLSDSTWALHRDTWQEHERLTYAGEVPLGATVPAGRFGKLWAEEPSVRQALGWATGTEQSLIGTVQELADGRLLRTRGNLVYALYPAGSWQLYGHQTFETGDPSDRTTRTPTPTGRTPE